jgi:hypothetical protein
MTSPRIRPLRHDERRRQLAALRVLLQQRFPDAIEAPAAETVDPVALERLRRVIEAPRAPKARCRRNAKAV